MARKPYGLDLSKPVGEKPVSEMSDIEIFNVAIRVFGTERFIRLVGWCTLFALVGLEDLRAAREALQERGLSRSAMYRALLDIRRLQCRLQGVPLDEVSTEDVEPLVRTLTRSGVPAGGLSVV
jgi:hypothetical protein